MFRADDATLDLLRLRWKHGEVRQNGKGVSHIGASMPFCKAWVRTAKLKREFHLMPPDQVYSHIPHLEGGRKVWRGVWTGKGPYKKLPNVQEAELTTDFSQKGVIQATISLDNVLMEEHTGVAGIYHTIERGYYSPWRGFNPDGRLLDKVARKNEWYDLLNDKSSEIVIVAGYGEDSAIPVFKGLVNDLDLTSSPDKIQIVARDLGQFLTDQNVFINAKVRSLRDPITFADRRRADKVREIRGSVEASSAEKSHPSRMAVDDNPSSYWVSKANGHPNSEEWITMNVPAGRYESIRLNPRVGGMEVYIAIKARDKNAPGGNGAKRGYGETLPNDEWIDEGKGDVPGHPGIPYVAHIESLKVKDKEHWFPDNGYLLGDDSKIRVFMRNLPGTYIKDDDARKYRAALQDFAAVRRVLPDDVVKERWILVDDAADVVRTVLQWCGLDREWEIENTGVRLSDKIVFNRQNMLIDIIDHICELTGYVFYMKPPSEFDNDDLTDENNSHRSMGIPVFRQNQAMRRANQTLERIEVVNEDDLLTDIAPHFTDEPLAYNIRVRGKRAKKKHGGRFLGADRTRRHMYVYTPPWSRNDGFPGASIPGDFRNANLKRYAVHTDEMLTSLQQCEIAALFIAFREALESGKVTAEFPALPTIHLDHQMAVRDTGTGVSTRIYVTNRTMKIRTGENGFFTMGVGGSLIDLPDVTRVRDELVRSLRNGGFDPGVSQWEQDHFGKTYGNVP